jgi:tetratricopeptide (TPR) repeat protein
VFLPLAIRDELIDFLELNDLTAMANMPYPELRITRLLDRKMRMWLWTTLAVAIFSTVTMGQQPEVTKETSPKWAATQNSIGNTLKDQAASVEGPEAVRLFSEAAAAYRRALSVLTRDSMPEDWATTQHSLGYVLQEQGVRSNGPEAARLLSDAVAAYQQALQVRTREQLPLHWAMTQNDLGNALQAQGARAEGSEARRLLAEAAAAYGNALLVFTREFMPRQWAMTQHNLGSALHEQGTRTDGPEASKLLAEAVAAYRQALLVRTREQMPQAWAITQNNLANALQAQGTRAAKPESLRLLDEALTAYGQSLLVFTREQTPRLWAMTKHNVGSALQEQGTRADGIAAPRLFREAVAAYSEALLIWTRQQLPQQWAMAQNNLARAYFNLNEWKSAAECYENVLEVHPDFRPAYERARFLEHEVLLNYQRGFRLNEMWLQRSPNDTAALASFAETHFTTGNFEECARRITAVLSDDRFDAHTKIPLRALEIANLIALNRSAEVPGKLERLIEAVASQAPDFKIQRSFAGVQHFIDGNPQFAANKTALFQLFGAFAGENRDAIIKKLHSAALKN